MSRRVTLRTETWPLKEPFVISRMRQDDAAVAVVEIEEAGTTGRGEADRSEAGAALEAAVAAVAPAVEAGASRADLLRLMPPGPARAAVDCALWDLEAKLSGRPAWALAGLGAPGPVTTVFTIGLGTPEAMGAAATAARHRPILKLKLGRAEGDLDRVRAVRAAAPDARLTVDANTGWTRDQLGELMAPLGELGVTLIEQPLPPGRDGELDGLPRPVPLAADESCTDRGSLPALLGRYDLVNIKIDKAGGLTEALALAAEAKAAGLGIMVGCNLGTSLAMAPGLLLAQGAVEVDLDGPLLLARDRAPALRYQGSRVHPPDPALWG